MPHPIILVTGANGGLGAHVTQRFLSSGAQVIGTARHITADAFGLPNFTAMPADLGQSSEADRLVAAVIARFQRIDVLVHVAGGFAYGGPIHETTDAIWEQMLNLNLRAAMRMVRAVIPHMREAKRGRIIAVGSRAGVEPAANIAAYAASKAALVSMMKTAALENKGLGITANVILPGTIDTEANRKEDPKADRSKWVSPDRLAALAFYLASEDAAEITGAAIPVYGAA
jgi:NAD(P)-dependent dehydrogenase (short-subunit alcohol dehydrogenase family)